MLNKQQSIPCALAQENDELRRSLAQIEAQIAAIEEQAFALGALLQATSRASETEESRLVAEALQEASALDPAKLICENIRLRAKLDYVTEAIVNVEETLLHLSDALARQAKCTLT